jgi:hypothetical protein
MRPTIRARSISTCCITGGRVLDEPQLQLPHPRMHLRGFVLHPLAEIRPHLVLPGQTPGPSANLARNWRMGHRWCAPPAMVISQAMEDFRARKGRGERITALTAYDYPTARLLDESGIDIILVGDSLGMVVLGYPDTAEVKFEEMLHHTRAVARGVKRALLVADLSIGTYDTPADAVKNAQQLLEAGAQAVKLEGGASHVAQIEAIVRENIPLMAHIGCCRKTCGKKAATR